jgi:hypothetical protein
MAATLVLLTATPWWLSQSVAAMVVFPDVLEVVQKTQVPVPLAKNKHNTKKKKVVDAAPNRILYIGQFGLGHRLSKLAAAHHLALTTTTSMATTRSGQDNNATTATATTVVPVLQVHWGTCGGTAGNHDYDSQEIFAALFGTNRLTLRTVGNTDLETKTVLLRNDVLGYAAGQAYKNARVAIPAHYLTDTSSSSSSPDKSPWWSKLNADVKLFRWLVDHFQAAETVRKFQERHGWHQHTMIGLHVRAGNGEDAHFIDAARGVSNTTEYVTRTVQRLQQFLATLPTSQEPPLAKPYKLFLATDQANVIAAVQRLTATMGIQTVAFPQSHPVAGVSYQAWKQGDQCLAGWTAAWVDMMLLSQTDMVVAAMRSTFTQIVPLALVFDRGAATNINNNSNNINNNKTGDFHPWKWRFCEADATRLSCFADRQAWLFRLPEAFAQGRIRTVTLIDHKGDTSNGEEFTVLENKNNYSNNNNNKAAAVVHKVMVHFPDIPAADVSAIPNFVQTAPASATLPYGDRINKKYRTVQGRKPIFRADWTLA